MVIDSSCLIGEMGQMGRSDNPFKGVNKVCAQCVRNCKQFENVILVNCPKFQSIRVQTPLSSSYGESSRRRNEGGKSSG